MDPSARTAPALAGARDAEPAAAGVTLRFPETEGRRSTTATCRAIVADAARAADAALAARLEAERDWRSAYAPHLRALTALAAAPGRAHQIAAAGVRSMRSRVLVEREGSDVTLDGSLELPPGAPRLGTGELRGAGECVAQLRVPYRGRMLEGGALIEQLERWSELGTIERSCAEAVSLVARNPEWLSLSGRTVALVGAGSEIGPLEPLCAWGADVVALDVPAAGVWQRIESIAERGSGTVRLPVGGEGSRGLDLIEDFDETRAWLTAALAGREGVLGMYAYADGGTHVLLSAAFDALAAEISAAAPATALAWLATPTDAYIPPAHDVERARAAYAARRVRRVLQAPAQLLSGGRLYRPAYAGGEPVADALIEQQGPNYAVAKRLQRWSGLLARGAGQTVSFNVAPATLTRSVTKNAVLAAAYAGARWFGIEIFAPATTRVLMAALLVHDLHREPRSAAASEEMFAEGAAHGGLWTAAYEPRSALGIAALAGLPSSLAKRRRTESS